MKRIISIVLLLTLLISCVPCFAENAEAVDFGAYNDSIRFIRNFKLMNNFSDESVISGKTMTRGEFASVIAEIIRYNNNSIYANTCTAIDIADSVYKEDIELVVTLGYMNGTGGNCFSPDEPLETAAAVKTLLNMAGYGMYADRMGGYPTGYLVTADTLNILSGVKTGEFLDAKNLSRILYNFKDVYILTPDHYITSGEIIYSTYLKGNEKTFMEKYLGAKKVSGFVTENGFTSITRETPTDKYLLNVGGKRLKFNDETSYVRNYIGRNVIAYYFVDENENNDTLVYAYLDNKQQSFTFDIKDYRAIKGNTIIYAINDDEEEEVAFVKVPYVIVNGVFEGNLEEKFFTENEFGYVTMVSSDGSNVYDTIIIESYFSAYVADADTLGKTVHLNIHNPAIKDGEYKLIDDGKKKYSVYDYQGNPTTFQKITSYSFIDISKNGDVYKIIIPKDNFIEDYTIMNYDEEYYGNGTDKYPVSKTYMNSDKNIIKPVLGNTYNMFINSFGYIVWFEEPSVKSEYLVGYALNGGFSGRGLQSSYKIKILTQNGSVVVFDTTEKVRVTDETAKKITLKKSELSKKFDNYKGLIQYKINEDREITDLAIPLLQSIDTDTTSMLRRNGQELDSDVRYRNNIVNGVNVLDANTKIFFINETSAKDESEMYMVINKAALPQQVEFKYESFVYERDSAYSDYMVIVWDKKDSKMFTSGGMLYVDKLKDTVNADGEEYVIIQGYNLAAGANYTSAEFTVKKELLTNISGIVKSEKTYDVKKGDIITYNQIKDEWNKVTLLYTPQEKYNTGTRYGVMAGSDGYCQNNNDFYAEGSYVFAYVLNIDSKGNITYTTQDLSQDVYDSSKTEYITNSIPYTQYFTTLTTEGNKTTLSLGELSDIKSYKYYGNNCSRILFKKDYATLRQVMILNIK